jgi:hypothetical protein
VATLVAIGSGTITVTASTSDVAFAPPTTVRPINDNFTKQCQVTSFTASSPGTTFGNVSVTLTGYGVQGQPGATSLSQIAGFPYINGNGPYGNASRSIKHIINH